MTGDPARYWSPASPKTLASQVARRVVKLCSRVLLAMAAVAIAQFLAVRSAPDAFAMAMIYGIGMFVTQWVGVWFLDLATGERLGSPPDARSSRIIYFFALALRSMPHAIFLAWVTALWGGTPFPDPALLVFFQVGLPLLALRKMGSPPMLVMPMNAELLIGRETALYQGIVERCQPGNWLENVKFVRVATALSAREALFLINLVHHDHVARGETAIH